MDISILKIFEETINEDLKSIIVSNSTDKEKAAKIKIRPVLIKDELYFQVSEYIGNKIFHKNYLREELLKHLPNWFEGLFRQAEFITNRGNAVLLVSKKGKASVNYKMMKKKEDNLSIDSDIEDGLKQNEFLSHNKKKNYILQEGIALPFLVDLGVMTKDGFVVKAKSDKFRQINRFLEYIEDVLPYLDQNKELTILDFGCGKSYLTFAMYYYLKVLKGYHINVIGLDLKADVINQCNLLCSKYGYDKLRFLVGDIASYTGSSSVDMVVTLHACDTATDYALYKSVIWGAKVILSVPCCQHELNKQIKCDTLKPVLKYGIVKERMAALFTDALRAEMLETKGYRVQLLEFIDMEHTPKNILIRAVKRNSGSRDSDVKIEELKKCMDFMNVSPCLYQLFQEEAIEEGNNVDSEL
jgi:SAM-dependent methyltransferase